MLYKLLKAPNNPKLQATALLINLICNCWGQNSYTWLGEGKVA